MTDLFCIPEEDKNKRFIIGQIGNRNILCIGINPNTADEKHLDATSSSIKRISSENGYDGWILANLYPRRNRKASSLEQEPDSKLILENVEIIKSFILKHKINNVWIAWGDDIRLRRYFKISAVQLLKEFINRELNIYVMRVNNSGNPTHPIPRNINRFFKDVNPIPLIDFDTASYIEKLEKQLK